MSQPLQDLQWLAILGRTDYKLSTICRNLFFDIFIGCRSTEELTTNCQLYYIRNLFSDLSSVCLSASHAFKTALESHLYKQY